MYNFSREKNLRNINQYKCIKWIQKVWNWCNVQNSNSQHQQSCEVTWRYARSCYDVAMLKGKSGDDEGKKGLLYQGNHDKSNKSILRVEVEKGILLRKLSACCYWTTETAMLYQTTQCFSYFPLYMYIVKRNPFSFNFKWEIVKVDTLIQTISPSLFYSFLQIEFQISLCHV